MIGSENIYSVREATWATYFVLALAIIIFASSILSVYRFIQNIMGLGKPPKTHSAKKYSAKKQDNVPHGEALLIELFKKLVDSGIMAGCTVYNQLRMPTGNSYKEADFLIVSPNGLFVVESKYWKGVTHVHHNYDTDFFRGNMFHNFGVAGSTEPTRVVNVHPPETLDPNSGKLVVDELILSKYRNPVTQARGYSKYLSELLDVNEIKNIVVFHSSPDAEIFINGRPLSDYTWFKIDRYTDILADNNFERYILEKIAGVAKSKAPVETSSITQLIESNLSCRKKIGSNSDHLHKVYSS